MREAARIAASLALAVACASGATALLDCTLDNCTDTTVWLGATAPDPSTVPRTSNGTYPATAHVSDDGTTWESSPVDGAWLDFPGQRYYALFPKENDGTSTFVGPYTNMVAYVSADPDPADLGTNSNFTLASGNLAEFSNVSDVGFTVHNDTCSQSYLRVVLTRDRPVVDAGVDAAPIAPTDAGPDGGAD